MENQEPNKIEPSLQCADAQKPEPHDRSPKQPWGLDIPTFCLLMHLSQFAGFVVPFAGIVLPIVMWATNKDEFPEIDSHGKNIVNWVLSLLIYTVIAAILMFVVIGFFLFFGLMLMNIIFAIIGAVKASQNVAWQYPLSIKFFK